MYNLEVSTKQTTTVHEGVTNHSLDCDDNLVMFFGPTVSRVVSSHDLVDFRISESASVKEELLSEAFVPIND